MEVKSFTFNDYQENTYLITEGNNCIIIDPGNYYEEENNIIKNYIEEKSLKPQFILITHTHIDHILGINFLSSLYPVKTYIPLSERNIYDEMDSYASMFGMEHYSHKKEVKILTSQQIFLLWVTKLQFYLYLVTHLATLHFISKTINFVFLAM